MCVGEGGGGVGMGVGVGVGVGVCCVGVGGGGVAGVCVVVCYKNYIHFPLIQKIQGRAEKGAGKGS